MRHTFLAGIVKEYCGVDIPFGFTLSAVDMVIENTSEALTKIELKYYTCLVREDIMDEIVLFVKDVANKYGNDQKNSLIYAGESSEKVFQEVSQGLVL